MNWPARTILVIVAVSVPLRVAFAEFSEEHRQYNTATESYVTEHLKWAKPYLGGRARVLILAPRWGLRETVELTQRMDLDATVFAVASKQDFAVGSARRYPEWEGFSHDTRMRELENLLAEDWDAVVYAGFAPRPHLSRVLSRVKDEGMGVLVMPEVGSMAISIIMPYHDAKARDHILKPIPIEDVPIMKEIGRKNLLAVAEHGKGRVAHLKIGGGSRGCFTSDVSDPVDFEYCFALVARTVLWLTGREPHAEISSVQWPEAYDVSTSANLEVSVDHKTTEGLTCQVDILRPGERNLSDALVIENVLGSATDGGYRVTLPSLPEGRYFFNVRLGSERAQASWYSGAFTVTSKVGIDSVITERETFQPDEIVRGQVVMRSALPAGSIVSLSLVDGFGRMMWREEMDVIRGEKNLEFSLPLNDVLHQALTIKAELVIDGNAVSLKKKEIFVPHSGKDSFKFITWDYGVGWADRVSRAIGRRMWSDFLVDAQHGGRDYRQFMRDNISPMPYITRFAYQHGSTEGADPTDAAPVRKPSLTDPEYREAERKKLQDGARQVKDFSPIGYSLGDENFLTHVVSGGRGIDLDFHPTSLESFRKFLKNKYGSLNRLNEIWTTTFSSWDQVTPVIQMEALKSGQYARWIDHRLHMEFVFADMHQFGGDVIREVDPGARVGFDGLSQTNSYHGYDFYQLFSGNNVLNVYKRQGQYELLRSFAPEGALTGMWFGAYHSQRYEAPQRYFPWLMLLHGMNSCWYFSVYGDTSNGNTWGAVTPDLTPSFYLKWALEEVAEIKSGTGMLLLNCERLHDGIAVHYSPASLHASSLDHTMSFVPDAHHSFITLIEDAGFQYEFVAPDQIETGGLDSGQYQVLVLPCSQVISEQEEQAIRGFVDRGGLLVADVRPGFFDHFGRQARGGILDDLFGIERVEGGRTGGTDLRVIGEIADQQVRSFIPGRSLDGAVATRGGRALISRDGVPAVIVNKQGKGGAVLFNFDISDYIGTLRRTGRVDGLRDLVRSVFHLAGIEPRVTMTTDSGPLKATESVLFASGKNQYLGILRSYETNHQAPQMMKIQLPARRHAYDSRNGVYLGETDETSAVIGPGRALLYSLLPYRVDALEIEAPKAITRGSGLSVSLSIRAVGEAPGMHVIHLELRDPHRNEPRHYRENILALAGKADTTIPIALNDLIGTWTITARDVATGRTAEAAFEVNEAGRADTDEDILVR